MPYTSAVFAPHHETNTGEIKGRKGEDENTPAHSGACGSTVRKSVMCVKMPCFDEEEAEEAAGEEPKSAALNLAGMALASIRLSRSKRFASRSNASTLQRDGTAEEEEEETRPSHSAQRKEVLLPGAAHASSKCSVSRSPSILAGAAAAADAASAREGKTGEDFISISSSTDPLWISSAEFRNMTSGGRQLALSCQRRIAHRAVNEERQTAQQKRA